MTTEATVEALPARRTSSRGAILFWVGFTVATALTGVATLFAVSGAGPIELASSVMLWLIFASLGLAALLTAVLAFRIIRLLKSRARHETGARLHVRFALLFSLAAVAPAIIVALFLGATISSGLEQWFSVRLRSVVENGAGVGKAYLREATENVRGEVLAMAQDLNRARIGLTTNAQGYQQYLMDQASLRSFPAAFVINGKGAVLAGARIDKAPPFITPSSVAFGTANAGDVSVGFTQNPDAMRALYRLAAYKDAYLYVVRPLESGLVSKLYAFDQSVFDYRVIEQRRTSLQTLFALSYINTAWLVLLGAVWLGLANATRISEPIGELAAAARRLASGDLAVRVDTGAERDEIDALGRAFNTMSERLEAQRDALVRARGEARLYASGAVGRQRRRCGARSRRPRNGRERIS
jgi:two-component system nitrogen regulation sensor histidine kinase NtrY